MGLEEEKHRPKHEPERCGLCGFKSGVVANPLKNNRNSLECVPKVSGHFEMTDQGNIPNPAITYSLREESSSRMLCLGQFPSGRKQVLADAEFARAVVRSLDGS